MSLFWPLQSRARYQLRRKHVLSPWERALFWTDRPDEACVDSVNRCWRLETHNLAMSSFPWTRAVRRCSMESDQVWLKCGLHFGAARAGGGAP